MDKRISVHCALFSLCVACINMQIVLCENKCIFTLKDTWYFRWSCAVICPSLCDACRFICTLYSVVFQVCVRARATWRISRFLDVALKCPDNFRKQRDMLKRNYRWNGFPSLTRWVHLMHSWSDLVHLMRNSTFHCVMATLALQQVVCSGIKLSRAQIVSFLGNFPIRASLIPFLFALLPLWMRMFRFPPFGGACHGSAEGSFCLFSQKDTCAIDIVSACVRKSTAFELIWVCLKIVYPYTQWLMIIIPTKWLYPIFRHTHLGDSECLLPA